MVQRLVALQGPPRSPCSRRPAPTPSATPAAGTTLRGLWQLCRPRHPLASRNSSSPILRRPGAGIRSGRSCGRRRAWQCLVPDIHGALPGHRPLRRQCGRDGQPGAGYSCSGGHDGSRSHLWAPATRGGRLFFYDYLTPDLSPVAVPHESCFAKWTKVPTTDFRTSYIRHL